MLRLWGFPNFDVEISSHNDSYGSPRGYIKHKTMDSDQQHIVTTESLLLKVAPVFFVEIFTCRFDSGLGYSKRIWTEFWKNEFVGRGDERRFGEKKVEGLGRTVDWDSGKVKGWKWCWFKVVVVVEDGLGLCLVGFIGFDDHSYSTLLCSLNLLQCLYLRVLSF
ncbi:hypothetical protein L6452_36760 [Arctium lappa]|uniref:Uncharacterized protein n=1 Tax=Arctium lappa TaxID=4217 RepID=A0ACB8Y133_ARCLA|nr:hypothetical protein L6452_36760 [Arctium lappa]